MDATQMRKLIEKRGGDPFTASFYGDAEIGGKVVRWDFNVVDDRQKLGDNELGRWITKTMDLIAKRHILPRNAIDQGPEGAPAYLGFRNLWTKSKWRRVRIIQRDFNRPYHRDEQDRRRRRLGW